MSHDNPPLCSRLTQAKSNDYEPELRLRRLRRHPAVRELVRETHLNPSDFVVPIFVKSGENLRLPIASMPGQFQLSVDCLEPEVESIASLNIPAVILFGIPETKDSIGSSALQANGVVPTAIRVIKNAQPTLLVMADLCCCEYTDHGHCGVLCSDTVLEYDVDNDETLALLVEQAIVLAEAGADVIAPSGMMDGVVMALREGLDRAGFSEVIVLSYAVKYASGFYGPFREAAEGAPQFGDRRSYQMDPANAAEALREADQDVSEGADMLMVKPAHTYLDIIYQVKQAHSGVPLGAYHVSGEYAMIKAAAANGWLDEKQVALETLLSIKRAGADFIITYYAKQAVMWLNEGN